MAEAQTKQQWSHTSALMALIANVNRDPKKHRAFKPADFDPTHQLQSQQQPLPRVGVEMLKHVFVDPRNPRNSRNPRKAQDP